MDISEITVEERPWGWWKVVHEQDTGEAVKVLCVNPGAMLSLQYHDKRTEYWLPLYDGLAAYTSAANGTGANTKYLRAHEVFKVERALRHRLVNPTSWPIVLVEVIAGVYDEDDITRLHDTYNRE